MPIPTPKKDETKKKFLDRCMGDSVMVKDYKDPAQRYAVCNYKYTNRNKPNGSR
jgi:hypothetical protein